MGRQELARVSFSTVCQFLSSPFWSLIAAGHSTATAIVLQMVRIAVHIHFAANAQTVATTEAVRSNR